MDSEDLLNEVYLLSNPTNFDRMCDLETSRQSMRWLATLVGTCSKILLHEFQGAKCTMGFEEFYPQPQNVEARTTRRLRINGEIVCCGHRIFDDANETSRCCGHQCAPCPCATWLNLPKAAGNGPPHWKLSSLCVSIYENIKQALVAGKLSESVKRFPRL